jgi:hypothetical protein
VLGPVEDRLLVVVERDPQGKDVTPAVTSPESTPAAEAWDANAAPVQENRETSGVESRLLTEAREKASVLAKGERVAPNAPTGREQAPEGSVRAGSLLREAQSDAHLRNSGVAQSAIERSRTE